MQVGLGVSILELQELQQVRILKNLLGLGVQNSHTAGERFAGEKAMLSKGLALNWRSRLRFDHELPFFQTFGLPDLIKISPRPEKDLYRI